jgi:UDP-N-acetylglucosamine 2-epimerase (non-hydrolysing)
MITIILGTRPEIIKMSPVIRECRRRGLESCVLHTGQHYSYEMDRIFFDELELPSPDFTLDAGSGSHAEQTGKILAGVERVLLDHPPSLVLVQGDTNTVLAGSLAAVKLHVHVGHVEAGLRSFDRRMPEEINRIIADHISDYLFAPTGIAERNLIAEGIDGRRVIVTGNTVVDAVSQNLKIARGKTAVIQEFNLQRDGYFLVTAHREENVDIRSRLEGIMQSLAALSEEHGLLVIFPMHPRTDKMLRKFGIPSPGIEVIRPLGYLEFLNLEANARLVLTDSGGVQEEACILGVPCVTLRDSTERPETIEAGSNVLAGTDPDRILDASRTMLSRERSWENPYGDGHAGEQIVDFCEELLRGESREI